MSYQLTTAKIWSGTEWVDATGGGIGTATVSATTGSPATGTFTDANGIEWNYYDFTGTGSITFDTAGYADILIVGGGGGSIDYGASRYSGGGGGGIRFGLKYVTAAEHTVTIGGGGNGRSGEGTASDGGDTSLGSLYTAGGGQGSQSPGSTKAGVDHSGGDGGRHYSGGSGNSKGGGAGSGVNGLSLNYNGSTIEFSKGGDFNSTVANAGHGGDMDGSRAGSAGRVIVKVPA